MEDKKKNNDKMWVLMIWILYIGLIIGRAIAIIFTHDDVTSLVEFWGRLRIWDAFGTFGLIIPIIWTIMVFRRKEAVSK